jgi:hypothetical protein
MKENKNGIITSFLCHKGHMIYAVVGKDLLEGNPGKVIPSPVKIDLKNHSTIRMTY